MRIKQSNVLYWNFTFSELYINDLIWIFFIERRLEKNILFVAMHRSDSKKCYTVYQFIGTPEHKLHPFSLVNIFYSEKFVFDENNRQQAREKIEHFLFSQVHTFWNSKLQCFKTCMLSYQSNIYETCIHVINML